MMASSLLRTGMADTGNPPSEHERVLPGHDWARVAQLALLTSGIAALLTAAKKSTRPVFGDHVRGPLACYG